VKLAVLAPSLLAAAAAVAALAACRARSEVAEVAPAAAPAHPFDAEELQVLFATGNLGGPPPDPTNAVADDPRAAHLGRFLFHDPRLSRTGAIACATCHDPASSWTDGRTLAEGLGELTRHTPSLWNVAYNRWFFWDGRADTLWSQALEPLENPLEHGYTRLELAHRIREDAALRVAYERIFGALPALDEAHRFPPAGRPVPDDPEHAHHVAWTAMTEEDRASVDRVFTNVGKCLAAFERLLVSRESPFDRYVTALRRGDAAGAAELSAPAVRGLAVFLRKGQCRNCHHGPNFTDKEFHDTRLPTPPELAADGGRLDAIPRLLASQFHGAGTFSDDPTGEAEAKLRTLAADGDDHGRFKTPTLRNVALTAPYMHHGQLASLEDVVRFYSTLEGAPTHARHPDPLMQPRDLSEREIADLVAFLESLTDDRLPTELLRQPASPSLGGPVTEAAPAASGAASNGTP
jgi:cytochrome c peroxidase